VGFGEFGDVALLDRKDLKEPHAAALWDSRLSRLIPSWTLKKEKETKVN